MIRKIKSKMGFLIRGLLGIFQNFGKYKIPQNLEGTSLGKSVNNKEILSYGFGKGKNKVLFIGGIHGNEIGTRKLLCEFLSYLNENSVPEDKTVYIIPTINPDGYTQAQKRPDYFKGGRIGRYNANNVDLNRNFPTKSFQNHNHWNFGKKLVDVFCGERALSEPETQVLVDFIKKEGISVLYSFHNCGKEIMGNCHEFSQTLVKDYVEKTGYKYISNDDWKKVEQTGTLKEYCDENGIAYVEVEGSVRYGSDFKKQKKALISALNFLYG